jgi:hypothetical protein
MRKIINNLYVGDDEDYENNKDKTGWSFVRACKEGIGGHRDVLKYDSLGAPKNSNYFFVKKGHLLALNLIDSDDVNFIPEKVIQAGIDFIYERLGAGDKVLVACNKGKSRAPSLTLMFLRAIGEMPYSFSKSEKIFKTLYPKYDPSSGVHQFAKDCWYKLKIKD